MGIRPPALINSRSDPPATPASVRAEGNSTARDWFALWLLRGGLAFVFTYAAAAMILNPAVFSSYLPGALRGSWLETPCLLLIAGVEVLVSGGLLWRRFTFLASLVSAAMMVVIVSTNLGAFDVLFRNVAIGCAALSLALQTRTNPDCAR